MRRVPLVILALALSIPLFGKELKSVALLDSHCAEKKDVAANPDAHSRSCMMSCAKNGYGVMVDGKFVKFDAKGNELAKDALKNTDKKDHLRVTVNGDMKGDTLQVTSLKID
jgi:hypothetical protein